MSLIWAGISGLDGVVGQVYGKILYAHGGTGPWTLTIQSGSLPGGLSVVPLIPPLNTTGNFYLKGTPSGAGTFTSVWRLTDSLGATQDGTILIVISAKMTREMLIPPLVTGQPYQPPLGIGFQLTDDFAKDALVSAGFTLGSLVPPFTYGPLISAFTDLLSDWGLIFSVDTLSSPAVIGAPANGGIGDIFTLSVTDSSATPKVADRFHTALQFDLIPPPIVDCNSPPQGRIGVAYTHTFLATGGQAPYTWSISLGALPDGITLNTSTGVVSGTPTNKRRFVFTVQVRDALNATGFIQCSISIVFAAWLGIHEPTVGLIDQTFRMDGSSGQQGSFQTIIRERGTADIPLRVRAGDTYKPVMGCEVFLQDQTPDPLGGPDIFTAVFTGTIDRIEETWDGTAGDRIYHLTAVSLEQCLDSVVVPPQRLQGFAGAIVTKLFNDLMTGAPISLAPAGVGLFPGAWIVSLVIGVDTSPYPSLSEVIKKLAILSSYIWYIDPDAQSLFFCPPTTTSSPFALVTEQVQWETMKWDENRADYRNRQILQIAASAFAHSSEQFTPLSSGQTVFVLRNPPSQITDAWTTFNTQNVGSGTFTGVPAAGDTITITYPNSSSIYNWAANSPYDTGQTIIDPAGHLQQVTAKGTSHGTPPTWNDSGSFTTDGPGTPVQPGFNGTVIWQDLGKPGGFVYTWVAALNNTNWGEVLIGANAAQCAFNLTAAINADAATAGILFSLPTWEHALVNADPIDPAHPTVVSIRNKSAGAGYKAALTESTANFTWAASPTAGGTTVFGTVRLTVGQTGTTNSADIYWLPGNTNVACVTAPGLVAGQFLAVEYTRIGGDCIQVEDTSEVTARAIVESGTGKYQRVESDTSQTSNVAGLLEAQQALAAYGRIPVSFSFETYVSRLAPGQELAISISDIPPGIAALLAAQTWLVQEVQGALIPQYPYLDPRGMPQASGHYRCTVTVINVSVIGSYLDFWSGIAGGGTSAAGSGTGGASAGGGGTSPSISLTTVELGGVTTIGTRHILDFFAGANIAVTAVDNPSNDSIDVTIAGSSQIAFAYGGDGSDGVVNMNGTLTFAGIATATGSAPNLTYTLARDVYATVFTVGAGITLLTANFRILATVSVTVNGTCSNSGQAASSASLTAGGLGGNHTSFAGYSGWLLNPWVSVRGGDGKTAPAGTTGAGTVGVTGGNASTSASPFALNPSGGRGGANGGNGGGGAAGGSGGGTGGIGGGGLEPLVPRDAVTALFLRRGFLAFPYTSASGDGAGGTGASGAGDGVNNGGSGGGSGGCGGGGGNMVIAAPSIVVGVVGILSSDGGNGGNGAAGGNGAGGTAAGGGGGGGGNGGPGGIIALIFHSFTDLNSGTHATGGAAGLKGAGGSGAGAGPGGVAGVDGLAGFNGFVFRIQT